MKSHDVVYLHPSCHPGAAGTWASFNKKSGVLVIECMKCHEPFVGILVDAEATIN